MIPFYFLGLFDSLWLYSLYGRLLLQRGFEGVLSYYCTGELWFDLLGWDGWEEGIVQRRLNKLRLFLYVLGELTCFEGGLYNSLSAMSYLIHGFPWTFVVSLALRSFGLGRSRFVSSESQVVSWNQVQNGVSRWVEIKRKDWELGWAAARGVHYNIYASLKLASSYHSLTRPHHILRSPLSSSSSCSDRWERRLMAAGL
jgi:hypothetical protein